MSLDFLAALADISCAQVDANPPSVYLSCKLSSWWEISTLQLVVLFPLVVAKERKDATLQPKFTVSFPSPVRRFLLPGERAAIVVRAAPVLGWIIPFCRAIRRELHPVACSASGVMVFVLSRPPRIPPLLPSHIILQRDFSGESSTRVTTNTTPPPTTTTTTTTEEDRKRGGG